MSPKVPGLGPLSRYKTRIELREVSLIWRNEPLVNAVSNKEPEPITDREALFSRRDCPFPLPER